MTGHAGRHTVYEVFSPFNSLHGTFNGDGWRRPNIRQQVINIGSNPCSQNGQNANDDRENSYYFFHTSTINGGKSIRRKRRDQ